jgi:hypothetical protein
VKRTKAGYIKSHIKKKPKSQKGKKNCIDHSKKNPKVFNILLYISDLNLKSTSVPKTLKFWI